MIKSLFESGMVYIIVASIAGLGLVFRIMELMAFKSLVSKKEKKEKSNGKRPATFLTFLKTDYTKKYLTGKKVNNVDAFVDKHMINREFCGLSVGTYKKICELISIITVASALLFSIWGKLYGRGENEILSTFFVGVVSTTVLIIVDCLIAYEDRMKIYRASFVSYIENEYFYYITTDEGVQKATMQTLASRQKKILMEEKESERKAIKEDANDNRRVSIVKETESNKIQTKVHREDEFKEIENETCIEMKPKFNKEKQARETQIKDCNVTISSGVRNDVLENETKETTEVEDNKKTDDAMLIDEILKGIFAQ